MSSTIARYDAFVHDYLGRRTGGGTTPAEPIATITGSGDPPTPSFGETRVVTAGARVRVYDRVDMGGFDIFRVTPAGDVTLWIKVGSAATEDVLWYPMPVLAANGPFTLQCDDAVTNASAANGVGDSADSPLGADTAGRLSGKVQAIEVQNYGSADTTIVCDRLN